MKTVATPALSVLLLTSLFVISSCDEEEKEPTNGDCRISTISALDVSSTYVYNQAGLLTGSTVIYKGHIDATGHAVIEYNSAGEITRVNTSEGTFVTIEYSDEGRTATTTTFIRGLEKPSKDYVFQFDSNGRIIKYASKEDANSYTRFEYGPDGNPQREFAGSGGEEYLATEIVAYDDRKFFNIPVSFYVSIEQVFDIVFVPQPNFATYTHNPTKRKHYLPDGSIERIVNVEYEYNAQGYPVKVTAVDPTSDIFTLLTYGYDCE